MTPKEKEGSTRQQKVSKGELHESDIQYGDGQFPSISNVYLIDHPHKLLERNEKYFPWLSLGLLPAGATAHAMGGGCPFSASGSLSGPHGHHGHGSELPSISRFFHQPKHLTISWAVNGCKFLTVPRWIFVAQPIRPPLPYATGSFLPGNPSSAAAGLQWWRIEKAISEGLFKGADLARPPLYICFHEIYVYILRVLHMNRQFKVHCCIKL